MKKSILIISVFLFSLTSCHDRQAVEELEEWHSQAILEEQNKAIINKWISGVTKDNYEQHFHELWAPDSKQILNAGEDTLDYDEFFAILQWLYAELPVITHEIHDMMATGDKVITYVSAKAIHDVESFGVPATGKELEWRAMQIFQLSDGKIQNRWEVADLLSMYEQLGMELQLKESISN